MFHLGAGQIALAPSGEVLRQRVQAQTFWPLGVDNAFSYSGDLQYLQARRAGLCGLQLRQYHDLE